MDTSIANSLAIAFNIHHSYKSTQRSQSNDVEIEVEEPVQTPA